MKIYPIFYLGLLLLVIFWGTCSTDFPYELDREYQDFGTEVFLMIRDEVSLSKENKEAKLIVIDNYQDKLIQDLNQIIEGKVEDQLQSVLINALPLYDPIIINGVETPGAIPSLTRDLASIIDKLIINTANLDAFVKLDNAKGESTHKPLDEFVLSFLNYDKRLVPTIADIFAKYEPQITEVLKWVSEKLTGLTDAEPSEKDSLLKVLLKSAVDDTWTSPSAEYLSWSQLLGAPVWAIRIDKNGNPKVNTVNGSIMSPYRDLNGDGLVDTDSEGDPIGFTNEKILIPPFEKPFTSKTYSSVTVFRDEQGRAYTPYGYLFQYFDAKRTITGLTLKNGYGMIERDWHNKLFTALTGILGDKVSKSDKDGAYLGFDTTNSGIKDLLWAVKEISTYERLPQLAEVLSEMASRHTTLFNSLLTETIKAFYLMLRGERSMTKGNNFLDDLIPHLETLSKNGMLRGLMSKGNDQRLQYLPLGWAKMLKYTKLDWDDLEANGWKDLKTPEDTDAIMVDPLALVDWTQPEKLYTEDPDENKSMNQKLLHLTANTNGAEMKATIGGADFIFITNSLAYMYMNGIALNGFLDYQADTAMIKLAIVTLQAIKEFSTKCDTPTPDISDCAKPEHQQQYPLSKCKCMAPAKEQTLFILHDHALLGGNPKDLDGLDARDHYGKFLAASQSTQQGLGLEPLMEVFSWNGRVQNFIDIFILLHQHWGSKRIAHNDPFVYKGKQGAYYMEEFGSNIRAVEEYLMYVFEKTQFLPKAFEFLYALDTTDITYHGETLNAGDELTAFLVYLFDSNANVVFADGSTTTTKNDKQTVVARPNRFYLLLKGLRKFLDTVDNMTGTAKEAWDGIELLQYFAGLKYNGQDCLKQEDDPESYARCVQNMASTELQNKTTLPILVNTLIALQGQIDSPVSGEDANEFYTDLVEFIESRGFSALYDVMNIIKNTASYNQTITEFLLYAINSTPNASSMYDPLLKMTAEISQMKVDQNALIQLLRFAGEIFEPQDRLVFRLVEALNKVMEKDPQEVFNDLAKNLFRSSDYDADPPAMTIFKLMKELFRVKPGSTENYSREDFYDVFSQLKNFLLDKSTGMERLYEIIQNRNGY